MKKLVIRRTKRTDQILRLRQHYQGDLHSEPKVYNRAFAQVLRALADRLETIDNA